MAVDKRGAAADATVQQRAALYCGKAGPSRAVRELESGDRELVYLLDCWANGARVH